jgi:hypothetical protein
MKSLIPGQRHGAQLDLTHRLEEQSGLLRNREHRGWLNELVAPIYSVLEGPAWSAMVRLTVPLRPGTVSCVPATYRSGETTTHMKPRYRAVYGNFLGA